MYKRTNLIGTRNMSHKITNQISLVSLPADISMSILCRFEIDDIYAIIQTCKILYKLATGNPLWTFLYTRDFFDSPHTQKNVSAMQAYKEKSMKQQELHLVHIIPTFFIFFSFLYITVIFIQSLIQSFQRRTQKNYHYSQSGGGIGTNYAQHVVAFALCGELELLKEKLDPKKVNETEFYSNWAYFGNYSCVHLAGIQLISITLFLVLSEQSLK